MLNTTYLTVSQFEKAHPAFTHSSIRYLILKAQSNGLLEAGAFVRVGRRVLINEQLFFNAIQNGGIK